MKWFVNLNWGNKIWKRQNPKSSRSKADPICWPGKATQRPPCLFLSSWWQSSLDWLLNFSSSTPLMQSRASVPGPWRGTNKPGKPGWSASFIGQQSELYHQDAAWSLFELLEEPASPSALPSFRPSLIRLLPSAHLLYGVWGRNPGKAWALNRVPFWGGKEEKAGLFDDPGAVPYGDYHWLLRPTTRPELFLLLNHFPA